MNYDITFCSNKNCKQKCERNQNNIPGIEYTTRHVWVSDFKNCEYFEKCVGRRLGGNI